jgi:hypothetical protein
MPTPTLVATAGAPNANSYATVAEADEYHDAKVHRTDWAATGLDTAQKTVALIEATRILESMYEWAEWPTDPEVQSLGWPRIGVLKRDLIEFVPDDEIPPELKNATAELARQLITADRTADSDVETQGITHLSAGSVSLTFKSGVTAKVVPDAVVNLLPRHWGRLVGRKTGMRELERA